jgi:hypothetical protein
VLAVLLSGVGWLSAQGCDGATSASFRSGELGFSVSATDLGIPDDLRDGSTMPPRVATIPCGMTMCPTLDPIAVTCTAGACDPDPTTVTVPAGVVDFDDVTAELTTLFTVVDRIEITAIDYAVQRNTLNLDLEPIEVFWGPEGAVDVTPEMGVHRLAVVPAVPATTTPSGAAQVDEAGQRALSDYLVDSSRVIRLFARTRVDIAPSDDFPGGDLMASAVLSVTASGSFLD